MTNRKGRNRGRLVGRATAVAVVLATAAPALGQTAPLQYDVIPTPYDSGQVQWVDSAVKDAEPQAIYSEVVFMQDAFWLRLDLGVVQLSGSEKDGTSAFLQITSLLDGGRQVLDAGSVPQWNWQSAYFNGSAVLVELMAYPNTGPSRVSIAALNVGTKPIQGGAIESQCGPTDDRTLSSHPWSGRHLPVGCTAWLFEGAANTNPTCFLSAGHCGPDGGDIIEFNVPLSSAGGNINFAHPDDQYPVDASSVASQTGYGNDWVVFGCFVNSNTGMFAGQAQSGGFNVVSSVPATDNSQLEMWGYGVDFNNPTRSQVQQYDDGTYDTIDSTNIFYNDLDTEGGSSGSPIYKTNIDAAIGIHTNGGCSSGNNSGTRLDRPTLQLMIATPQGICCAFDCDSLGPENDNCADALPIDNGSHAFSTIFATTDGPIHGSCQFDGQTYEDIWYTYEAACSGPLTVSTCNLVDYDSDLVVYDGCDCGNLQLLACNDDGDGCAGFSSIVNTTVTQGNCYLIRVGGWDSGHEGSGTLLVDGPDPSQCTPLTGACCFGDGSCDSVTEADCIAADGEYQGDGVSCTAITCPVDCPCDLVADGVVNVDDLLFLLAAWGGPGGDCNGDGTTNVDDLLDLLAAWGACP